MKYNKKIEFKNCALYHNGDYCTIIFNDGTETSNWPLPNDANYVSVAKQCGFDENSLMDYCYEHELFHILLPLEFFVGESYVASRTARRIKMSLTAAKEEEYLVYLMQVYKAYPDKFKIPDDRWQKVVEESKRLLYVKSEDLDGR